MTSEAKKVLVIGSGPIIIGQAAEFDYAGTQACRSLREEGYKVVLVNSNPATIMTDTDIADRVYVEPISLEFVTEVIKKERPWGLLATLGGQVGLNMAVQLSEAGVLEEYGVKLLGTTLEAIKQAEDRELFKEAMKEINQPVPESDIFNDLEEAVAFANRIGYPIIIRPAYTLGGTGGGIAHNEDEMYEITRRGLKLSPIHQILAERSVAGWKEIEYEVMRDSADNCIIVCNMENIDPVGVHTGDSIVVAPSQTLNDIQYQMLRTASVEIIRYLKIEGGCNVQYALNPNSNEYIVIEVNPRVSRSSALASKATGYPIAKVAAKIAVGMTLDQITNAVTGETKACFEPTLDYVVTKFPRWPFEKFNLADRTLGTQMKATGEVMAIDRSLEGSLLKAIRSLEIGLDHIELKKIAHESMEQLIERLHLVDDERIYVVAEALRKGISVEKIHYITKIDTFFIEKIKNIVNVEKALAEQGLTEDVLRKAKRYSFTDSVIARYANTTVEEVRAKRKEWNILPTYKYVDTCAAEFESKTPYYYSAYAQEDEVKPLGEKSVVVLGSGPIRIGQGVEFDYCSVHSSWALRKAGYQSIMINNNPETVSTDFDISDSLYFEPLTVDDVMEIINKEQPAGVIAQFGGQTAINLAGPLAERGVKILGTSVDSIDMAEDRERFDELLAKLGIPRPVGALVTSDEEAQEAAKKLKYPLIVRPSYVLGGRAMEIVYNEDELKRYLREAVQASNEAPVLLDRFLDDAIEVDVDCVSDGKNVVIGGIMQHIEQAGVHSGDSACSIPPYSLNQEIQDEMRRQTVAMAKELGVVGLMNVQFAVKDNEVYILEVNPRASRTVPFVSKCIGTSLAKVAARCMAGQSLESQSFTNEIIPEHFSVKEAVFPFAKFQGVDPILGPEMKSTGEVMGVGKTFGEAYYKAIVGSGDRLTGLPVEGETKTVFISVRDSDKKGIVDVAKRLSSYGFTLVATGGTHQVISDAGIECKRVNKVTEGRPHIVDMIKNGEIQLVINTTEGKQALEDSFSIRRNALQHKVFNASTLNGAVAVCDAYETKLPFDVYKLQGL